MVPFSLSVAAARYMKDRKRGKILNIGSNSGMTGVANNSLYCKSKAVLHAITMSFAVELGPYGIRANALAPGTTLSEGTAKRIEENHGRAKAILDSTPLRRFATPDEIAAWAAFIVSEEADFANGTVFVVDGGKLAGR
ncbi:MAG: SDR family oxidoreductase [SAR324 cluster bacterium]|nr:SDR family oxidoreductase [SAR324 cluster bacterium]